MAELDRTKMLKVLAKLYIWTKSGRVSWETSESGTKVTREFPDLGISVSMTSDIVSFTDLETQKSAAMGGHELIREFFNFAVSPRDDGLIPRLERKLAEF